MKRSTQALTALSLVAALGTGAAFAAGAIDFPDEVKSSSIKLPRGVESQAEFAKHAKVAQQEAEAAALSALPGEVVKAKLDDEDGYLVWQIDVKHTTGVTEVAVDAGNAKVLAMEAEDDDDHEDRNERR
ncbi:PepSY domain-containing protein [Pelomicrobium sp. G1]|uniref:PepSY domain-containing protein n=1 Tax=unclassified Pelomicrobium TaxID=2815318 RepID=UPI003F7654E4